MDYDRIALGKVRKIDYDKGVGEIVTKDNSFFFTINEILNSSDNLQPGDVVKFRAELVQDKSKAYFVSKVDENYELNNSDEPQSKTYKPKGE